MKKSFLFLSGIFFFIGNTNSIKIEDSFKVLRSDKEVIKKVIVEKSSFGSFSQVVDTFVKEDSDFLNNKIGTTGVTTEDKLDSARLLISHVISTTISDAIDDVKSFSGFPKNRSIKEDFEEIDSYIGTLSKYQSARLDAINRGIPTTGYSLPAITDLSGVGDDNVDKKMDNITYLISRRIKFPMSGDDSTKHSAALARVETLRGATLALDITNLTTHLNLPDVLNFILNIRIA